MKKIYEAATLYKLTDSLLKISERQVAELKVNISLLEDKDTETRNNYERQISNLTNQIELYKSQVVGYEKLIKRERNKRRLITAAGILTTGAAIYLSTLK